MSNKDNNENYKILFDLIKVVLNRILIGICIITVVFLFIMYIVPTHNLKIDFSFSDAFISIIATLIGVMVTFVIGFQIVNAIQVKKDIDEMKKDIERNIDTVKTNLSTNIATVKSDTKTDLQTLKEHYKNDITEIKNIISKISEEQTQIIEDIDNNINGFNYIIDKTIDYVELKKELKDIAKKVSECERGEELENLSILFIKQFLDLIEYSNNSNINKINFDRKYYFINYFTQLSKILQHYITADYSSITIEKNIIIQRIKKVIEKEASTNIILQLESIIKCLSENDEQYINKIIDDMY